MSECLYIVPCSQTKAPELKEKAMAAREAYRGQAFMLARQWCEAMRAKWCILSGGYGFLWPDTIIEHYDCKILPVKRSTCWDDAFEAIKQKQYGRLLSADRYCLLGSRLYAANAEWLLGREVAAPLAGLPIGKMLQILSRWNRNISTLAEGRAV